MASHFYHQKKSFRRSRLIESLSLSSIFIQMVLSANVYVDGFYLLSHLRTKSCITDNSQQAIYLNKYLFILPIVFQNLSSISHLGLQIILTFRIERTKINLSFRMIFICSSEFSHRNFYANLPIHKYDI